MEPPVSKQAQFTGRSNQTVDRSWPHHVTGFSSESNSSQNIAVATEFPELLFVNSATGRVVTEAANPPALITHLQFSHSLLFTGAADGHLRTHDSRTGMKRETGESDIKAHSSGIEGLQVSGNLVFTIGWGMRYILPHYFVTGTHRLSSGLIDTPARLSTLSSRFGMYGLCERFRQCHFQLGQPLSTSSLGALRTLSSRRMKGL
jgi:hypothetical protein